MEAAPIFVAVYLIISKMTLLVSLAAQMTLEHLWVGPNRAMIFKGFLAALAILTRLALHFEPNCERTYSYSIAHVMQYGLR